ncbi:zinc-ribbon domain-containing protein [Bordetella sp. N]|uniref:zinc-ribbon domain-containing protein n=1 Tax=Bordetella sp. N TaxID=1746199 RepID=UPI0018D21957|nr:zinc-ribbon domain-containing protein [Bordetella sp. N]
MFCPNCSNQNRATDVSCMKCGTTLIHEAKGHSKDYRWGALYINVRMYAGIGAALGLALALLSIFTVLEPFYLETQEKKLVVVIGIVVGAVAGCVVAWKKRKYG